MSPDDKLLDEVAMLLSHSLEGDLTEEQFCYFKKLLQENRQAREHYYRLLSMYAALKEAEGIVALQDDSGNSVDPDVWDALSIEERTAPAIDIPLEKQTPEKFQKIQFQKIPYKINRFSIVTLAVSAAAILLIALFLRFAPNASIEVATLSNALNAVFEGDKTLPAGTRLACNTDSLWLREGMIELTFDYGARVVIEAPAEFQLNSAENMMLSSGRLYSHVPGRSKGFTVETPNSRVIDLGTEFAIKVDFDGTSDLHMIKGKASLLPGGKGQTGQGQILTAGQARRVDKKGSIQTIDLHETDFVRNFSSDRIWRGQDVDLADIIGGGNGLGTGRPGYHIDPLSGQMGPFELVGERTGNGQYVPVKDSPFIDGVFVPDGGDGAIQVTSSGNLWDSPDTINLFKYNISNSLSIPENLDEFKDYNGDDPKEDVIFSKVLEGKVPLRMLGIMGGTNNLGASDTSIFMHANLGITFDLEKIRSMLSDLRISNFHSTFGIGEITETSGSLDVWVLVDGQARFSMQEVVSTDVIDINIELSDIDRFLTLVITDRGIIQYDWGLFMNPRLSVE